MKNYALWSLMDLNKSDDINSFDGEYVAFKEEIVIKIR